MIPLGKIFACLLGSWGKGQLAHLFESETPTLSGIVALRHLGSFLCVWSLCSVNRLICDREDQHPLFFGHQICGRAFTHATLVLLTLSAWNCSERWCQLFTLLCHKTYPSLVFLSLQQHYFLFDQLPQISPCLFHFSFAFGKLERVM